MKIRLFEDYNAMSAEGASIVIEEITRKPDLLLCTATGSSPLGLYEKIKDNHKSNPELYDELRIVKLDEWVGLGKIDEGTCERYLKTQLLDPLQVSKSRYFSLDGASENPVRECARIMGILSQEGPIDLCILGLGKNGHLGLNEPAPHLNSGCHVASLTLESQQHSMITERNATPTSGMTLGMGDILKSKRIILLVSGEDKLEAREFLMSRKVSTECPASFLWLHPAVDCLMMQ